MALADPKSAGTGVCLAVKIILGQNQREIYETWLSGRFQQVLINVAADDNPHLNNMALLIHGPAFLTSGLYDMEEGNAAEK